MTTAAALPALRHGRAAHDLILPLDDHPAFGLRLRRGQEVQEMTAEQAASITHSAEGDRVTFTAAFPAMTVCWAYEPYGRDGLLACQFAWTIAVSGL